MKYYLSFSLFLIIASTPIFGQVLGQLSYDNSTRRYIPPPVRQQRESINGKETTQTKIACADLINYIEVNGNKKETIYALQLINSSWLKEVNSYSFEDTIIVVAEIKEGESSIFTKKYIFCGIPNSNWDNFYNGYYDIGKSYGERFHKYIIDYECNCN